MKEYWNWPMSKILFNLLAQERIFEDEREIILKGVHTSFEKCQVLRK